MKSKAFDCVLQTSEIATPLGVMIALADEHALCLLKFADPQVVKRDITNVAKRANGRIVSGSNDILVSIEQELEQYFSGKLHVFQTPFRGLGSLFQQEVWKALCRIPYGETCSYHHIAQEVNKPTAYRAVARANATNPLAIIVPCHRVIYKDGSHGGYAGGIEKKLWFLRHEKRL